MFAVLVTLFAGDNGAAFNIFRDRFACRAGKNRAEESGLGEWLREVMPESAEIHVSSGNIGKAIMPPENAAEFEAAFADNWHGMRPQKNESGE